MNDFSLCRCPLHCLSCALWTFLSEMNPSLSLLLDLLTGGPLLAPCASGMWNPFPKDRIKSSSSRTIWLDRLFLPISSPRLRRASWRRATRESQCWCEPLNVLFRFVHRVLQLGRGWRLKVAPEVDVGILFLWWQRCSDWPPCGKFARCLDRWGVAPGRFEWSCFQAGSTLCLPGGKCRRSVIAIVRFKTHFIDQVYIQKHIWEQNCPTFYYSKSISIIEPINFTYSKLYILICFWQPRARFVKIWFLRIMVNSECCNHSVEASYHEFPLRGGCLVWCTVFVVEQCYQEARPVILEPIMLVEMKAPMEFQGPVIGDINRRKGVIVGSEQDGDDAVIIAHVSFSSPFDPFSSTHRNRFPAFLFVERCASRILFGARC